MGYDTYWSESNDIGVTLKIGPCDLGAFQEGDSIDAPDGIYVGTDGAVVIRDKEILFVTEEMFDANGIEMDFSELI